MCIVFKTFFLIQKAVFRMFVCVCLCEQMFVHNASETGGGRGLRSGQECGRQCCSDAMTTQEDTYATAHACVCVCMCAATQPPSTLYTQHHQHHAQRLTGQTGTEG